MSADYGLLFLLSAKKRAPEGARLKRYFLSKLRI